MFEKEDYFLIGTLARTHGYSGEFLLKINNLSFEDLEKMESVFIEFDGILVPFFISELTLRGDNSVTVRFDDIETQDQASEFVNCSVYSTSVIISEKSDTKALVNSFTGYRVIDKKLGLLGTITGFLDITDNPLFKIKKSGKEILLPVTDEFIMEVDKEKKTITVQTPEGLIDIYKGRKK